MRKNRAPVRFDHPFRRWQALAVLLLLATQSFASEWQFTGVNRVVAISDVHGAYDAMVVTFLKAAIIDEDLNWVGGDTHLVITGDLLDRGPDSRKVMDLIMALEDQAIGAGGRVHQLIGNHEAMNLAGDLRYVALREYAAFADDESEEEREQWFQHFRSTQTLVTDEAALRAEFITLAPPGFFGHRRAFRADGHYGKWLLEKPLMVVIDGTAFVHGGLSPYVAEHGLDGVNGTMRTELTRYLVELNKLEDQALVSPIENFYDIPDVLKPFLVAGMLDGPVKASVETVIELNASSIHGSDSPLWYRGSVGCNELIEGDALQAALDRIGAERVVIGHTPTLTRRILQRMSGRVVEIDTGMNHAAYKGSGNALEIKDGILTVINESGESNTPPVIHPRRVGYRSADISADDLVRILSTGEVTNSRIDDHGRTFVEITEGDTKIFALFEKETRKKGFLPELAAYRLDRMIGLDMVPVTVRREHDGKKGTMQFYPSSTKTETERVSSGKGSSAWCPLQRQWNAMYIFDVLAFNVGRNPEFMLYSPDNWQLILMKHDEAFKNSKGRPPYLRNTELGFTSSWHETLKGLSDEVLLDGLGDVLGKRELAAVGKRRDRLLREAGQ